MEPVNSFISLAEKLTILNKNCIEILTKTNDLVSSQQDTVTIAYDDNGAVNSYTQPTVGYLKNQIDVVNQNMKRLSSIDGYTYIRDGLSYKRVMTSDLNREPSPISSINQAFTFTPINNHFFESLMNPMLSVTIDLTDKVEQSVNKILSRRYIIRFDKNPDGSLTEKGTRSFNSYVANFLGQTNINISDFISWYDNPTNDGIVVDTVQPYDEQIYDLKLKELSYYGVFSVIKVEIDDINNKIWYHLNTIKYYGSDGTIKSLAIGDELIINKLNAGSRYKIKEVNTDSSNTKVRLENIEGYDPVIVGTNVLKYYSDISNQKSVQINIGFDEYVVLFVKPINTYDNIVGSLWSKGVSFYTNDLILDTNNNINLATYYIRAVYDYGTLLRDMVSKKIPTIYGAVPNVVSLTSDNFKVIQINKHLTEDKDQDSLKKLHSEKSTIKTKISQLNAAILQKTAKLNTGGLTTNEKQSNINSINKLKDDLDISTKNLSSLLTQIAELNTGQNSNVDPKYRVRGFWRMPEPILSDKTPPQHVIQFRIQYRYSSKSGNSNNIQTFNYNEITQPSVTTTTTTSNILGMPTPKVNIRNSSNLNTGGSLIAAVSSDNSTLNSGKSTSVTSTSVSTTTENPDTTPKYANFTNWVEILSDVRKRYWDQNTLQWYWRYENVSDAEVININQLDIPIQPNERVEIRIKSISEVGWPDSLLESDWSNVLTIDFPDDLKDSTSDNLFIAAEASQDLTTVMTENLMNTKGVSKHIDESYSVNQDYFAHQDKSIQVNIKSNIGTTVNLYQYLTYLTERVTSLEQVIAGVRGTLNMTLYKNSSIVKTITNNSNTIINIECEDYGSQIGTTGRTYSNSLNVIEDYIVSLENTNQSGNLGFLSNRTYSIGGSNSFYNSTSHRIILVDANNKMYTQNDNQFIWFADKDNNDWISTGATNLYDAKNFLSDSTYNLGTTTTSTTTSPLFNPSSTVQDLFGITTFSDLQCVIFPHLPEITNFIENGQDKQKILKPQSRFNVGLKIFFKFDSSLQTTDSFTAGVAGQNSTKIRKVRFWFETNDNTTYQFTLTFNLKRFRTFLKPKTEASTNSLVF